VHNFFQQVRLIDWRLYRFCFTCSAAALERIWHIKFSSQRRISQNCSKIGFTLHCIRRRRCPPLEKSLESRSRVVWCFFFEKYSGISNDSGEQEGQERMILAAFYVRFLFLLHSISDALTFVLPGTGEDGYLSILQLYDDREGGFVFVPGVFYPS